MSQIRGEELFGQPPDILWQSLSDPAFLCQCFPGVDRVLRSDARSATVIVRPGFSFVRGTLEISFEFSEVEPPCAARVVIQIKGIGSSAELETRLNIASDGAASRVTWQVNANQFGGLLKAVSQGLMQAAAQKVAADTWAEIRRRISSE
jgi:carbon monoxide dehydrogenase subunit G